MTSVASSGGRNRTNGLLVQSQASLPTATTPDHLFRHVVLRKARGERLDPSLAASKAAGLPLSEQIRDVERRMEESTKDDAVVQRLLAQKGVGLVTAVTMRAEIGFSAAFHAGSSWLAYCAVTPMNASSGKRQADGGLIRAGNLHLRTMLIESAHRLARYVPKWKTLKDRLKSAGKPASVAAAAVANRWIRHLYWNDVGRCKRPRNKGDAMSTVDCAIESSGCEVSS